MRSRSAGRTEVLLRVQRPQHRVVRDAGVELVHQPAERGFAADRLVERGTRHGSIVPGGPAAARRRAPPVIARASPAPRGSAPARRVGLHRHPGSARVASPVSEPSRPGSGVEARLGRRGRASVRAGPSGRGVAAPRPMSGGRRSTADRWPGPSRPASARPRSASARPRPGSTRPTTPGTANAAPAGRWRARRSPASAAGRPGPRRTRGPGTRSAGAARTGRWRPGPRAPMANPQPAGEHGDHRRRRVEQGRHQGQRGPRPPADASAAAGVSGGTSRVTTTEPRIEPSRHRRHDHALGPALVRAVGAARAAQAAPRPSGTTDEQHAAEDQQRRSPAAPGCRTPA